GDGNVGLSQCGGVVGAVARHRDKATSRLILANEAKLVLGRRLGKIVIDTGFGRDRGGGELVVAGNHHRLDADGPQLGETFLYAAFDDVLQLDNTENVRSVGDHKRCASPAGDVLNDPRDLLREHAAQSLDMDANGAGRALADLPAVDVDPAHARMGA